MCGFLRMLAPTLENTSEAHAAVQHLAQVAQDAAVLPWPAVREWTHACMSHIEDRNSNWHDVETFTNERTRLSWMKGRLMEADRKYPCPLFNKSKCEEKATHAAEGTTWLHLCALCLHMTGQEKPTHGASTCRHRNSHRQGDDRYDNRYDNRSRGHQNKNKRDKQDTRPKN